MHTCASARDEQSPSVLHGKSQVPGVDESLESMHVAPGAMPVQSVSLAHVVVQTPPRHASPPAQVARQFARNGPLTPWLAVSVPWQPPTGAPARVASTSANVPCRIRASIPSTVACSPATRTRQERRRSNGIFGWIPRRGGVPRRESAPHHEPRRGIGATFGSRARRLWKGVLERTSVARSQRGSNQSA